MAPTGTATAGAERSRGAANGDCAACSETRRGEWTEGEEHAEGLFELRWGAESYGVNASRTWE